VKTQLVCEWRSVKIRGRGLSVLYASCRKPARLRVVNDALLLKLCDECAARMRERDWIVVDVPRAMESVMQ
jgi:hypothetical protein